MQWPGGLSSFLLLAGLPPPGSWGCLGSQLGTFQLGGQVCAFQGYHLQLLPGQPQGSSMGAAEWGGGIQALRLGLRAMLPRYALVC